MSEIVAQEDIAALVAHLHELGSLPQFCTLHLDERLDPTPLLKLSRETGMMLMGGTSCSGALTADGVCAGVLFAIDDGEGSYGTALRPFDDDPSAAAEAATRAAIDNAGRTGERPDLVWIYGTPGEEERVLSGIERVVGPDTPIAGGSAADNSVAGGWSVFAEGRCAGRAVAIGVLYPSGEVSLAYHNGYAPTERSGIVTRVEGRRVAEIDARPAAEVYSAWTGGAVCTDTEGGQTRSILGESTFWPLGRETHRIAGVPYFILAHPAAVDGEGGLHLFADVAAGERLTQMTGSAGALIERAGRVARIACEAGRMQPAGIAGALIVYCGGCMLGVHDRLDDLTNGVCEALPAVPFAGVFTFGEQGPILNSGNRHGNLMVSCILFSK
ncbi:FIST C-terminal domain-containing protein [Rhodovulum tesquicola]|uniref:FIST signal transduction protein n=1 Tax=Rhodovulum TaxID=34008 RepID=UPI0014049744|nr:FIST N-terminal domain-containing protein [Rhodovulum steppense]MCO8145912.1 FIST C-terminal domain-containing protein [Rhodovulum tesquicola]